MNKILYLKITGVKNYKNATFEFNFTNQKNARQATGELSKITDGIYTQNVIACTGINASGKTTAARLINWAIDYLATGSIYPRNFHNRNIFDIFDAEVTLSLVAYSTKKKMFFRYAANLKKKERNELKIVDDSVSYKRKTGSKKSDFLNFDYSQTIHRSEVIENMKKDLKKDFIVIDNSLDDFLSILRYTAFYERFPVAFEMPDRFWSNSFRIGAIPKCRINYLDNAIELIELVQPDDEDKIRIKFKNRDTEVVSFFDLESKLSTGTLRWLNLFDSVVRTLKHGSYMIIDEIEMSFHKSLAIDIIKMFNSLRTNPYGATLIFTTHYSEILDFIHRTDSIYITSKDEDGLSTLTNLSLAIKRNDLLKSDAYLKGLFNVKTAPSAQLFDNIIEDLVQDLKTPPSKEQEENE